MAEVPSDTANEVRDPFHLIKTPFTPSLSRLSCMWAHAAEPQQLVCNVNAGAWCVERASE